MVIGNKINWATSYSKVMNNSAVSFCLICLKLHFIIMWHCNVTSICIVTNLVALWVYRVEKQQTKQSFASVNLGWINWVCFMQIIEICSGTILISQMHLKLQTTFCRFCRFFPQAEGFSHLLNLHLINFLQFVTCLIPLLFYYHRLMLAFAAIRVPAIPFKS